MTEKRTETRSNKHVRTSHNKHITLFQQWNRFFFSSRPKPELLTLQKYQFVHMFMKLLFQMHWSSHAW